MDETVEKQRQISIQIDLQQSNLSQLEDISEVLADRVVPAIRCEPQVEEKSDVEEELVPIAGDLRVINKRIHQITTNLQSMVDRLEL